MKKISILIPCYNEAENVVPMSEAIVSVMTQQLAHYDYELVFIDNCSDDGTRDLLRLICAKNPKIKAILNAKKAQTKRRDSRPDGRAQPRVRGLSRSKGSSCSRLSGSG